MSFIIDLHVHTGVYSPCSTINPSRLIPQALKAGLDGLVITEHQYQWHEHDLAQLIQQAGTPQFLLLAGFEYTSRCGDILIYGLTQSQAHGFQAGLPPEEAVQAAHDLGGICIGAHPTRATMGFDERILTLPLDALEVRSMNLKEHEQCRAIQLAQHTQRPPIAASDAHHIQFVGRYATEFFDPITSMPDLQDCVRRGRFRLATNAKAYGGSRTA